MDLSSRGEAGELPSRKGLLLNSEYRDVGDFIRFVLIIFDGDVFNKFVPAVLLTTEAVTVD